MKEHDKYFWMQAKGLVRALDLPKAYKFHDKRIYCVNKDCFCKDECLFWNRYNKHQLHYSSVEREMNDIKRDQRGWRREQYDKHYPNLDYRGSSFGFYVEQRGAKPCYHFVEYIGQE